MVKKCLKKILILGVLAIMIFLLAGCFQESPQKQIENLLRIELPNDIELLFNHRPTGFVQGGRHPQYTLFALKENPEVFLQENDFKFANDIRQVPTTGFGLPSNLNNIPEEFRLNWDEDFYWLGQHPTFLMFFPNQLWLVFIIIPN